MGRLVDVRGRVFEPRGAGPLRLVSLVPSTTESLFALGRGADLVGVTRFCVRPAGPFGTDRWIGGTKNPKIEKIVALSPDLVLANREENREEDVAALEAAGVPVWVAEPRRVEDASDDLRAVGRLVGRAAEGERLAARIEAALARARDRRPEQGPRVGYLIWREPWMVAGHETFIGALLEAVGARVPFPGRYPEVTPEELRDLDLILLASEPFPFEAGHREELVGRGLSSERIRLVDGQRLSWHGVRLIEGIPYAAALVDGEGREGEDGRRQRDGTSVRE